MRLEIDGDSLALLNLVRGEALCTGEIALLLEASRGEAFSMAEPRIGSYF